MAQKRDKRFTIRAMPWRPSLATAGQQSSIDELTGCWKARNATSDLDGLVTKRPGLTQWGQTLKKPDGTLENTNEDAVTTVFLDFLNGVAPLAITDSANDYITTSTKQGVLRTNVQANATTTNIYTLSYIGTTTGDTWSLRFMFRGVGLPAYDSDTKDDCMVFRGCTTDSQAGKEFGIWSGGLYYRNASDTKFTLVTGSATIGGGGWNCVEVECDTGGNTSFYLNDTLLETVTSSTIDDVNMIDTGALFEFQWEVPGVDGEAEARSQYTTHLSTIMYNDTIETPFEVLTVSDISGFKYRTAANSAKRCILIGADKYIYHDNALEGAWRPLHSKQYANVFFTPYRKTIVWSDNDGVSHSNIIQWDGRNDPESIKAPFMTMMTEHQQRLVGLAPGTDRVYYSGDRQIDVWYNPSEDNVEDEFEEALAAGYWEIPLKHGDRNTALFGDYYGTIIVFTKTSVWQISGSGLFSWSKRNISQKYGCVSPQGVAQVDNNIWFLSDRGLVEIVPVDTYGGIQTQPVSGPISDLWRSAINSLDFIAKDFIHKSKLSVNTPLNLVCMAVPLSADIEADNIYVFNTNLKTFLGPWELTNRCMAFVEIGPPTMEVMMHGDESGRVGYTNVFTNADFTSTAIEMELESPIITGRSLEQAMPGISTMKKSWRTLRLWVLPRGDWDVDVTWYADADSDAGSVSKSQNVFKAYVLGDTEGDGTGDFRLDVNPDGMLSSMETLGYIEIDLDKSGYGIYFNV